ncbi:GrpB family protein [Actinotalea solisilvae]|uniref:GrpB family protein n=1 Tax=Actinotalea solisilvae TaxID=2072922 RepID=UPI0018F1A2AB|nr:GrpB family protein [Actinotalea solisilvae]
MQRSDDLLPTARTILAAERERLAALGVGGDLELVGGSSVPGALTRGDVDLHLRVEPALLAAAVRTLRTVYDVVHPEIWQPTLATFAVPDAPLPTGVAVTPVGSEHDVRFTVTWRRVAAEPALLAEYNALKTGDAAGYEERKSAFFDRVVAGARADPGGPPLSPA